MDDFARVRYVAKMHHFQMRFSQRFSRKIKNYFQLYKFVSFFKIIKLVESNLGCGRSSTATLKFGLQDMACIYFSHFPDKFSGEFPKCRNKVDADLCTESTVERAKLYRTIFQIRQKFGRFGKVHMCNCCCNFEAV